MSVVLDLIVILIIALFTFIGYKQGLIKTAIKITSFFIAIIIALVLYKPVSALIIKNTTIDDKIESTIIEKITPEGMKPEDEASEATKIPQGFIKEANNTIKDTAETITVKIIEVCTVLILYLISRIVLKFIAALGDLIAKLPILKQFNKLGGTIFGALKGLLIVYVILAVVYLISPLLKENATKSIDETILTKAMYNNNIITKIILYDEILKTLFIVCTYRKNDGTSPNLFLTIINVSACNENPQSASLNGPKSVLMGKT